MSDLDKTKPVWAQVEHVVHGLESLADDLAYISEKFRCEHRDGMGRRCTLDQLPAHEHRVSMKDLP